MRAPATARALLAKFIVMKRAHLSGLGIAICLLATVTCADAQSSSAAKPAASQAAIKPEELDALLAPVALYPDQLLAQVLLCSMKPGDVVALNGWLSTAGSLKGTALQDAAAKAGFEESFVILALFPQTVAQMAKEIAKTTRVGQAFTADRAAVFAAIQRLRAKAQQVGTLKSTPQQDVETKTTSTGQQVIVIEPSNPQVVYVPQYNSQVVYTTAPTTTVVVQENNSADAAAAGLIGFAAGIAIGAAVDNDYYYGPYGWHGGGYMYNDAWDDYYDAREDAREDWSDHRQDMAEERGDRARTSQEQRTERQENRTENRPESQAQREQRRTDAQAAGSQARSTASSQARSTASTQSRTTSTQSRTTSTQSRGSTAQRSGTRSDAFSGYSSGQSTRAASSRGQRSRGSSGGGRRR